MPSLRVMPAFMALAAVAAFGLSAGCSAASEEEDVLEDPESDLAARESGFGSDPDYVVRQRVLFEQEAGALVRFERQPFSQRAKRWHVYPMTVYPGARIALRLMSDDRNMAHVGEVRLYGPALSDGSFPKARTVTLNERGQAELSEAAFEAGRYVVVVGPHDKETFLSRYPGNVASLTLPGPQKEPRDFAITLTADGWTAKALDGGETFRVLAPKPERLEEGSATLRLKSNGSYGTELEAKIGRWSNHELYTPAAGNTDSGVVGRFEGDVLELDPGARSRRLLAIDALRVGKSDPFLLSVIPETLSSDSKVPADLRGKKLALGRLPDCSGHACRVPVVVDESAAACTPATSAACGQGKRCFDGKCLAEVPAAAIAGLSEAYKPLFIDPQEPSTYSLEIACRENCMPTPVDRTRMTKYPVYFAHGFNSDRTAWKGVISHLAQVPGFTDRARAENVPAFEPTDARADRLRQRLSTYIQYLEEAAPIAGERMRVNLIAHSMGGLDSRTLLSSPRFNEQCERSECTNVVDEASGATEKVDCCAPALAGKPTMWRDRIASVTTLSTPHRGSSFASWAIGQMSDDAFLTPGLKAVAQRFFGFDEAGFDGFRRTLDALSVERGEEREKDLVPPNASRVYTWACATKQEKCSAPGGIDAPPKAPDGTFLLPPPTDKPTLFSWAAMSCATGGCGSVLDPMLLVPYGVMNAAGEKKNDGVVGIDRARYGIFMGVLPADHFDWTRTSDMASSGKQALEWLFGVKTEPVERFHQVWLARLAAAGY